MAPTVKLSIDGHQVEIENMPDWADRLVFRHPKTGRVELEIRNLSIDGSIPNVEVLSDAAWVVMAAEAFRAYSEDAQGQTYDAKPTPGWYQLPEQVRQHWVAAVKAVAACLIPGYTNE
jgi:hypothetical protein